MPTSLSNSLLIDHLLIQIFPCTYHVLRSQGRHSPTYLKIMIGVKYVSKGLKKYFYRQVDI